MSRKPTLILGGGAIACQKMTQDIASLLSMLRVLRDYQSWPWGPHLTSGGLEAGLLSHCVPPMCVKHNSS
jgi:hypothetical protein